MNPDVDASNLDYTQIHDGLINQAISALGVLRMDGLKLVVAESCTGGLIATALSEAPGAAECFEGAFVVYTPEQKYFALKITPAMIEQNGTVSAEVAEAMAEGALRNSRADIAVAVTGVAGPETDEKGNPVGLVYFGCARRGQQTFHKRVDYCDMGRSAVRYAAAMEALTLVSRCAVKGAD
jgi:nicotinamide-nucleotide amidase